MMIRVFAVALYLIALANPAAAHIRSIQVEAVPVLLHPEDPAIHAVGGLRYRGGLALSSKDKRFGGFSGITLNPDGKFLTAVSDKGEWLTIRLRYDSKGNLAGIGDAKQGPLIGADGKPLKGKRGSDAESVALAGNGDMIVGFERRHRLLRYNDLTARPSLLQPPSELSLAPFNSGVEAMTLLGDGRLLLISEGFVTNDGLIGWVGAPDDWRRVAYASDGVYLPTGAATLPGGDVMVLERRYSLITGEFSIRLRRLQGQTVGTRAVLEGRLVAQLKRPLTTDNFEGIDARKGDKGETLIMILSDDNFSRRQRTLLLMFEVVP